MKKKLDIYEKQIEIRFRKIDILNKKSNIIYWAVIIFLLGFIAISVDIYNEFLYDVNKQEKSLHSIYDRGLKIIQQDTKLNKCEIDRNAKILEILNKKDEVLAKQNDLINGIKSKKRDYMVFATTVVIIAFLYLMSLLIRINFLEHEIKALEVKILNIMERV